MANQRANVPQFGNWGSENNVPYTVYFDNARKNRGGKMINPNDPQENPEMFGIIDPTPPQPRARPDEPVGRGAVRPTNEQRVSREDGDFRQFTNSPARNENLVQKTSNELNHGGRGQRPARSARPSAGSELSFERSPLHPHYQGRVTGRGGGSPALEGRSYDSSHGTPAGRSRMRPARGDESPEKGAAVPKFGDWKEDDPQSAENYTHIFDDLRKEKNNGPGNISSTPKHPSYDKRNQQSDKPKKCCFPWW